MSATDRVWAVSPGPVRRGPSRAGPLRCGVRSMEALAIFLVLLLLVAWFVQAISSAVSQ